MILLGTSMIHLFVINLLTTPKWNLSGICYPERQSKLPMLSELFTEMLLGLILFEH